MCKLILTRSEVLTLILKAKYLDEVARAAEASADRGDDRPLRVRTMER